MKRLIKTALAQPRYIALLLFSLAAAFVFTAASQLEMFSLGVITKKGPDFFELFAPIKNGELKPQSYVSKKLLDERFTQLDIHHDGIISKDETEQFLQQHKKEGVVNTGLAWINKSFPIESHISYLIIALISVALFKALSLFVYRYGSRLLAISISRDLRQKYFEHLQKLSLSFYQEHNIGALSSRVVNDAYQIADSINSLVANYLQTPFAFITTLTLCFFISWKLSLLVFFGFPLLIIPIVIIAQKVKRLAKQIQKKQESFASVLVEFLAGIQTIKIFAMEDFSLNKYTDQNEQMALLEKRSARYDLSSRPILHTIGIFCLVVALLFGLYGLHLPLHEVLFYCGLLVCVYEPVKKFAEENARIQRGIAAAERMYEILDTPVSTEDTHGATDFHNLNQSIEFENVHFGYGSETVLKGVSFTVKKGEKVAICGPTGAGKSTIALLLPRLYEIEEGVIRIDGKPLHAYTLKSLREKIAFVPQKPFLFFDTVAANIAFGKPYSFEEIQKAAIQSHADEFIVKMKKGYNTLLAESGKTLSGGQQQRIAIARALIKSAPILVMDEATSSLDAVSEDSITQALHSLRGEITQIIIAHRLSTIEDADRIIYLEKGVKIAEGTKNELLASCPPFKKMWDLLHKK
jgi:putative ABC transport system ATP-binding protein